MSVNPGNIEKLLQHIDTLIETDPTLLRKLTLDLSKITRQVYAHAIADTHGYCMRFKIFESQVFDLLTNVKLTTEQVKQAFIIDWEVPPTAYMVCNVYYHILLLFVILGIRKKIDSMQKDALALVLIKLWNGRLIRFIRYCNADVMRYVIANLNGKYNARKHDTPMTMILQHSVPTLLQKYGPGIAMDCKKTKTLFDQGWVRFNQTFISRKVVDLDTGIKKGKSGLAPLYYDAYERNLKISTPGSNVDALNSDNDVSHSEHYSINDNDEVISQLVNYIVMNFNAITSYDDEFLRFINLTTMVNSKSIEILLGGMHNIKYSDYIREIVELMFKQLGQIGNSEICSPAFINETIKKKFISSKHSPIITQLKNMVDILLEKIFDDVVVYYKYSSYSAPRRGHLRKVIFYGIAYNMQKFICKSKI